MGKKRVPDEIEFRAARPKDFERLVTMLGEMAEFLDMEDQCWIGRDDIEDQAERLQALKRAMFGSRRVLETEVLLVKNNLEGFCTYYMTFSTYRGQPGLYLEDIYVAETYRRYGLGKALMGRMANIAELRNCCRMHWVAPKGDEDVNKFYRGLGARLEEGWNSYQQDDGLRTLAHAAPRCAKAISNKEATKPAKPLPGPKRHKRRDSRR